MEIKDLVNDLSFNTFQALRVEVLKRHEIHAAQVATIVEFLMSEQPDVCSSIESGVADDFCANYLSQLFHGVPNEISLRAVTRYRELKEMQEKAGTLNTNTTKE